MAGKWGVKDNGAGESDGTHRPILYLTYDNLGEVTSAQQYDGDGYTLTTTGGVPVAPPQAKRRARVALAYDNQQRIYQVNTFSIDQTFGSSSVYSLNANGWYDHRGNLIKVSKGLSG